MEQANVVGQCVMQRVADTASLVDPVASMWNEVRVDHSCRRANFPTHGSVVAGDVCGPGHGLQNEVRVDRSCCRAISPTHGSVVAGDVWSLAHGLQKPDEVSMCNGLHADRSHRRAIFPTHLSVVALVASVASMWN